MPAKARLQVRAAGPEHDSSINAASQGQVGPYAGWRWRDLQDLPGRCRHGPERGERHPVERHPGRRAGNRERAGFHEPDAERAGRVLDGGCPRHVADQKVGRL